MREGLDFVVSFTLVGAAVIVVVVAITVGVFLIIRRRSSRGQPAAEPAQHRNFVDELDLYAAIGEDGFRRLIAAFYRQIPGDPILGPMYPAHDLAGAESRLRDFLVGRFGGPQRYIEQRGHPRLRMRHAPFPIDPAARERWLELMDAAIDEAAACPTTPRRSCATSSARWRRCW